MSVIKLYSYIFFHFFILIFCFLFAGKLLSILPTSNIYIFKAKVTSTLIFRYVLIIIIHTIALQVFKFITFLFLFLIDKFSIFSK